MKPVSPEQLTIRRGGVTVTRTGVSLGAEISVVYLTRLLSGEAYEAIEAALVEHEVIVFRDQDISSSDLIAFGRRFGELTVHPFAPRADEAPELIKFTN